MRKVSLLGVLVVVLNVAAFTLPPYPPPIITAEVISVTDGDTIDVLLTNIPDSLVGELTAGSVITIRYIGINAPEVDTEEGRIATELNASLVEGKAVYLELDANHWDRYERLLAYVYLDPHGYLMVNAALAATPIVEPMPYGDTPKYTEVLICLNKCLNPPPSNCCSWQEAAEHEGERIWVYGPVKSVKRLDYGRVFINIGNPYPETPRFTIMIDEDYVWLFDEALGSHFEEDLVGKIVWAFGRVEIYKGQPEIKPTAPDQLQLECPVECDRVSCK